MGQRSVSADKAVSTWEALLHRSTIAMNAPPMPAIRRVVSSTPQWRMGHAASMGKSSAIAVSVEARRHPDMCRQEEGKDRVLGGPCSMMAMIARVIIVTRNGASNMSPCPTIPHAVGEGSVIVWMRGVFMERLLFQLAVLVDNPPNPQKTASIACQPQCRQPQAGDSPRTPVGG